MDAVLLRLALLLDPRYKLLAVADDRKTMPEKLIERALTIASARKCSEADARKLIADLQAYIAGVGPTSSFSCETTIADVEVYWHQVSGECPALAHVAILLLQVVPHSAALERIFSTMGWLQSDTRNSLSPTTLQQMTTVRLFYQNKDMDPNRKKQALHADLQLVSAQPVPPVGTASSDVSNYVSTSEQMATVALATSQAEGGVVAAEAEVATGADGPLVDYEGLEAALDTIRTVEEEGREERLAEFMQDVVCNNFQPDGSNVTFMEVLLGEELTWSQSAVHQGRDFVAAPVPTKASTVQLGLRSGETDWDPKALMAEVQKAHPHA